MSQSRKPKGHYITAIKRDPASEEKLFSDDLFHGALFVYSPTPSGSDRWLLNKSDPKGHETAADAVKLIAAIYPTIEVFTA
jgi:hypothetical protein